MNFTRLQLSRYIRIITGHNNLFYHRSNVDSDNNNAICRFCLEDVETFIHFATDCPALWTERRDVLHQYVGDPLTEWDPAQLLDFSFTPRITGALEMDHGDRPRTTFQDPDNSTSSEGSETAVDETGEHSNTEEEEI